jgi:dihydroflavonol-4-reductase
VGSRFARVGFYGDIPQTRHDDITHDNPMNRIAFVTGAAGFLGRHLLEALEAQGWKIHVLLRRDAPAWMQQIPNLTCSLGALDDADSVQRAMPSQCDAVFHLAGNVSSWRGDHAALHRDHVMATRHVLDAAVRRSAKRLVMTSTLGIFDRSQGPIRENTPLLKAPEVNNPYLLTKLQADQLLDGARAHGLSVVRIHPSHMLGRHDTSGWISLFAQAHASRLGPAPKGSASFCLASDVARAHLAAALHPQPSPRYVIATADTTYRELFNAISMRLNKPMSTRAAPTALIKAMARLSDWRASVTRRAPTITPGLADILTSRMIGRSQLAHDELGLPATDLPQMLAEAHAYWTERRLSSGSAA